jgi:hypothetical protein
VISSPAVERVRAAVEAKGGQYHDAAGGARCRGLCHDGDADDTVSVQYITPAGRVRMRCFKGCPDEDVIAAYGLTWADLYDKPHPKSRKALREFEYTNPHGRLLGINSRTPDKPGGGKDFYPLTPNGQGWDLKASAELKDAIFNWPRITQALAEGREIYLCAGEHDAESLTRLGLTATNNFGGELGWKPVHAEHLKGGRIVIVLDNDETGRKRLPLVTSSLLEVGAVVTAMRPADGFKDVTDMLNAGRPIADLVPVPLPPGGGEHPVDDEVARKAKQEAEEIAELDQKLLKALRDGAWLDEQEFAELVYAVEGLIPEGFTLLIGPPKAGKSWLILALLLAIACHNGYALGNIPTGEGRLVLYLALEDGDRRMQDRCRALLGDGAKIPALFHYMTKLPSGGVVATIDAFLRRYPDTALVVIDTLGKVMPPAAQGESAYQRDYRVGGSLKRIADDHPGLALVVLHHDRKAGAEDFVDSVSGTHGLAGAADTIVVLARARQSIEGILMVTGRDVEENEYALTLVDGKWNLDGSDLDSAAKRAMVRRETGGMSDRTTDILALARESPGGVTPAEVAKRFPDVDNKTASTYLGRLADGGKIRKLSRGKYGPLPTGPSSDAVESVESVESEGSGTAPIQQANTFNTVGESSGWFDDAEPDDGLEAY